MNSNDLQKHSVGCVTGAFLQRNDKSGRIDVWMSIGALTVNALEVDPVPHEPGQIVPPSFSVTPKGVQQLMDELWLLGVRPTGNAGKSAETNEVLAELKAQSKHLDDMRTLVFTFMDLKK